MRKFLNVFLFVIIAVSLGLVNCGGSTGGTSVTGDLTGVTIVSSEASGDFTPSLSASVGDDGELKFTMTALDVDSDGTLETPTISSVTATSGGSASLVKHSLSTEVITCADGVTVGSSGTFLFDIGFSLDTTLSMQYAVEALSNEISDFATTLTDAGVDVSFAVMTLGDAFDTKDTSSSFTDAVSDGVLGVAPSFDTCERPSTGADLQTSTNLGLFFDELVSVYPAGCNGEDYPENYLGSLDRLNAATTWRTGATRILVSIGDDCSHTDTSYTAASIIAPWIPPAGADLASELAGVATVHVVGPETTCSDGYYEIWQGLLQQQAERLQSLVVLTQLLVT